LPASAQSVFARYGTTKRSASPGFAVSTPGGAARNLSSTSTSVANWRYTEKRPFHLLSVQGVRP